jgi:peptidoglycan/xylan/chitin deacetylase (PgdA/CDA1 family)
MRWNYQQKESRREHMARFPILMYHRISSTQCPLAQEAGEERRYALSLEEFAWQMDSMLSLGYRGVSVGDAFDASRKDRSIPKNWIVLTFDDGNRSDFVHALPLLVNKGFSATFFIGASRIGSKGGLEEGMIGDIVSAGMEIGSHGLSHQYLPSLSDEEERVECARSKQILGELSGCEVRFFALPGGRFKSRTIRALRNTGYSAVCTSKYGYNSSMPSFLLKRFPVHQGTSRAVFHAMLRRSFPRLLPGYCRSKAVGMTRTIVGENIYRRIRKASLRG